MTSLVFACLVLLQEPVPPATRTAAPTRDQSKQALENHKKAAPRLPMPPDDPNGGALARVNNGRFRAYYIMPDLRETPAAAPRGNAPGAGAPRPTDPAFSLDTTFKVKLFWICSRANDCFY